VFSSRSGATCAAGLATSSVRCFSRPAVATFLMTGAWLGGAGVIGADTVRQFLIGLPALFAGTWLGLRLYGRLDETAFRNVVLIVLLVSGIALML
jgi:uncharacterized membrane protein YfcA